MHVELWKKNKYIILCVNFCNKIILHVNACTVLNNTYGVNAIKKVKLYVKIYVRIHVQYILYSRSSSIPYISICKVYARIFVCTYIPCKSKRYFFGTKYYTQVY